MSSIYKLVKIKNITLLFIIGIVLGFSSVILYFGMKDKKENINQQIKLEKTQLDLLYTKKVFELQNTYTNKLEQLIHNQEIISAFEQRDRKKLDRLVQPYFDSLIKENPNFELICFGLPDMTAFYRAHMQKKFGDDISRVQGVTQTVSMKKRVSGFMVAKLGLYYRVTFPVFKRDKFIGIVAFGINLGYVNDFVKENLNTESAIVIKTKELRKSKWYDMLEEGEIGSYTIIASNGELISSIPENISLDDSNPKMEINQKHYHIINDRKIYDINNKPIAKVILFQDITKDINTYNLYLYTFMIILALLILVMGYVLVRTFNEFLSTITSINDDLKELNTNLEQRVEEEVSKNREKEKQLFEQSKRAQLGEMIGNIAHQWRQPLSMISTAASGMQIKKEMGILDNDDFNKTTKTIVDATKFLSETIEHFREFLKEDKPLKDIVLQDEINKTLSIVDATLANNSIDLIKHYDHEPIRMRSIPGEIAQVILNIISNAKDVLVEREIKDKQITIEIKCDETNAYIIIEDNAGGIDEDVLPRIFDPYFTTKHQSIGTGIGLYMSNDIVTKSLKGKIYAKNTEKGARFYIETALFLK